MSQNYLMPMAPTDSVNQAMTVHIPESMEALRTAFAGATEPSSPVAYQMWADTTTGLMKQRNAANSAWITVWPLAADLRLRLAGEGWAGTHSASKTDILVEGVPRAGTIKRLRLFSGSATTSSSGVEWQVALKKYPNAAPGSPVQLFSTTVGTFTTLSGVGGGVEHVANKALIYVPNQNATVLLDDALELTITKVGAIGNLTTFRAAVDME